eukprot:6194387-Pleurochrysis_carterae.AAC.1
MYAYVDWGSGYRRRALRVACYKTDFVCNCVANCVGGERDGCVSSSSSKEQDPRISTSSVHTRHADYAATTCHTIRDHVLKRTHTTATGEPYCIPCPSSLVYDHVVQYGDYRGREIALAVAH